MNSYLSIDYAGKTHKKICRKIIRKLASAFASCLDRKLDYIGMGSLFFEDFTEFYASGWIDGMTSIEYMRDADGAFDERKYRRFLLNKPYASIRLLPLSVREAVELLPFDRSFLTWFDYDSTITRETIEETAAVIRKAACSGMLASSTGTQIAYSYKSDRRALDMDAVRASFGDMFAPEPSEALDGLTWDNFVQTVRDLTTPYYQRLVVEKNKKEGRNFQLMKAARLEYRQPSVFVIDIWLLIDAGEISVESVRQQVLGSEDAGFHRIDMPVLTEREKKILGSRRWDDPARLAEELALDVESVRKYLRYWEDLYG